MNNAEKVQRDIDKADAELAALGITYKETAVNNLTIKQARSKMKRAQRLLNEAIDEVLIVKERSYGTDERMLDTLNHLYDANKASALFIEDCDCIIDAEGEGDDE